MAITRRKKKDGKVSYQVRIKDHRGRWFPAKTFLREVDAERYERQAKLQVDAGLNVPEANRRRMTFAELWQDWQQYRGGRHVSKGWMQSQDQMARDYLLPVIGSIRLESLSERHVMSVLSVVIGQGKKPATQRLVFNLLHCILESAVRDGILPKNVAVLRLKPKVPRVERAYLPPGQAWHLLEVAKDHFLGPAIWLGTLAGLRSEAIQGLRWRAVDFERQQIVIKETYKRKERSFGPPKGRDVEYVPLARALADYLKLRGIGASPDAFVASGRHGGMLDHHVFNDGLRQLCKTAGVPRVTPHELRHSCTEIFFSHGASEEDVRRLLNHKDASTTRRYIHPTSERLQALAQGINTPQEGMHTRTPLLALVR